MRVNISADKITDCVIRLIEENGVKFTVDDVAENLGISKRTIYQYFDSKISMVESAVDAVWNDMQRQNYEILELVVPLSERLEAMMQIYPTNINLDNVSLDKVLELSPRIRNRVAMHTVNHWEVPLELLDECIKSGEIINISHDCFKVIMTGIFSQAINYDNHKAMASECVTFALNGLKIKNS